MTIQTQLDKSTPAPEISWEEFQKSQYNTSDERLHKLETESERDPVTGRISKGPTGTDGNLMVKFTMERVFSKLETFKNKGEPTWVLKEFITIVAPGHEKELTRHSPVEPFDIWRFPKEYERFKAGLDQGIEGTALKDWKLLAADPNLIKELMQYGIYTVEQLASTSDSEGAKYIRAFHSWKQKARAFVDGNKKSQADINLEEKMAEMQAVHTKQIESMQAMIDKLLTAVGEKKLPKAEKPKASQE